MEKKSSSSNLTTSISTAVWIMVFSGIALAVWLASRQFVLPPPRPTDAPATEFSAARTLPHLSVITAEPRPVGSPGHQQTREYLISEIRKMGVELEIQETSTVLRFEGAPGFSAGTVRNVIARLPGTAPTGAIALDAHYDGAATGPAAGDIGAGVASLLELMRILKAAPPLKNDVIFVFADAEEVGDLGAHAFATQHPWMKEVRLALNYEGMGSSGPAYLYVTSENNRQLIEAFARAAPYALGNSFITGLFGLFPEQRLACDLQDYLDEGSEGYGFVFTGNITAYHTMLDTKENLNPRTVQQLGDNTLGLLRHFGQADLNGIESPTDAVFFAFSPGAIVHYPAGWALPLSVGCLLLLLAIIGFGIQQGQLRAGKTALATMAFLLGALLATVIGVAGWQAVKSLNPNLEVLLIGYWGMPWFLAGILLLAATAMSFFQSRAQAKLSFEHQAAGALLGFALLSLLLSTAYPVGHYLFLWPALFGALALYGWLRGEARTWSTAIMVLASAVPAIILIVPVLLGPNPFVGLLIRLDAMTGMPLLAIDGFFAALLAGLLLPLLGLMGIHIWRLPAIGLATALLALGIGWAKSGYDSEHPRPEGVRYELDADKKTAMWVTGDARLGEWTARFFAKDAIEESYSSVLQFWPTTFAAPAPVADIPAPEVKLIGDNTEVEGRKLSLLLRTARAASMMQVHIQAEDTLAAARLAGHPLQLDEYRPAAEGVLTFNYTACPPEGIELGLEVAGKGAVNISVVDISNSLPEIPDQAVLARPEGTMPALTGADATVVKKEMAIPAL